MNQGLFCFTMSRYFIICMRRLFTVDPWCHFSTLYSKVVHWWSQAVLAALAATSQFFSMLSEAFLHRENFHLRGKSWECLGSNCWDMALELIVIITSKLTGSKFLIHTLSNLIFNKCWYFPYFSYTPCFYFYRYDGAIFNLSCVFLCVFGPVHMVVLLPSIWSADIQLSVCINGYIQCRTLDWTLSVPATVLSGGRSTKRFLCQVRKIPFLFNYRRMMQCSVCHMLMQMIFHIMLSQIWLIPSCSVVEESNFFRWNGFEWWCEESRLGNCKERTGAG